MDHRSFDRLARLLGDARDRRTGLKALVGGVLGAGGLAALHADADADADARRKGRNDAVLHADKKKRKRCRPACGPGFDCVKGQCICVGAACGEARTIGQTCTPGIDTCVDGNGQPTRLISCQPYGNGVGTLATDTATTRCLGNRTYATADASECASYLRFDGACTNPCNVYLNAGPDDAARGAALRTALQAFVPTAANRIFFIEGDPAGVQRYVTREIVLDVSSGLVIDSCQAGMAGTTPVPVVSGGWSGGAATDGNRVLNATITGAGDVVVKHLTFADGNAAGDGGAVRIVSTGWNGDPDVNPPTFQRVTIRDSRAGGNGGGLFTSGSFRIAESTISGNVAGGDGGGWYARAEAGQVVRPGYDVVITGNAVGPGKHGAGFYVDCTDPDQVSCSNSRSQDRIVGNAEAATTLDCSHSGVMAQAPSQNWTGCGCGFQDAGCEQVICNGVCCPPDQGCVDGACAYVCEYTVFCGGVCCPPMEVCNDADQTCYCANLPLCNGACCAAGTMCFSTENGDVCY